MSDENLVETLVEQARVRLERAVEAGAGKPAQAALAALTVSTLHDDDKTPVPSDAKKKSK